ncbi:MAG: ankyrin repeat domain-containing protein, partial [Betaproteobacteria bacterium]|nr:ankyrin repeat domain-containing protein [Betaproteobacteria bacterium]
AVHFEKEPEVLELLLAAGADPAFTDAKGKTAWDYLPHDLQGDDAYQGLKPQNMAASRPQSVDGCDFGSVEFFATATEETIKSCIAKGQSANSKNSRGETPLHNAVVLSQNPKVIKALLDAGAEINSRDRFGSTPLHAAADFSHEPKVIKVLLDAGADVNSRDRVNGSPLHNAIQFNQAPVVELLLAAGSDINDRYRYVGGTLLHMAVHFEKEPEVLELLLAAGVDPALTDDSGKRAWDYLPDDLKEADAYQKLKPQTATATQSPQKPQPVDGCDFTSKEFFTTASEKAVNSCLQQGQGIDVRNAERDTPVHMAARYSSDPKVTKALLAAGADANSRNFFGGTPLHAAAQQNKEPQVIEALLAAGADVNATDDVGITPLQWAIMGRAQPEVIEALLAAPGADADSRHDSLGASLLHTAAMFNQGPKVIEALLSKGADVNSRSDSGQTPLHWAATHNEHPETIEALINAGADLNSRSSLAIPFHRLAFEHSKFVDAEANDATAGRVDDQATALHFAAGFNENPQVIGMLVSMGADIESRSSSQATPLHWAAALCNAKPGIIKALLDAGADINSRAGNGWTALHFAAFNCTEPETIEILLTHGADGQIADQDGKTPGHYIRQNPQLQDSAVSQQLVP